MNIDAVAGKKRLKDIVENVICEFLNYCCERPKNMKPVNEEEIQEWAENYVEERFKPE